MCRDEVGAEHFYARNCHTIAWRVRAREFRVSRWQPGTPFVGLGVR